jgi:hypothetical protein
VVAVGTVSRSKAVAIVLLLSALISSLYIGRDFIVKDRSLPGATVPDERLRNQVVAAEDQFNSGKKDLAIATLGKLVIEYPKEHSVHFLLGAYLLAGFAYDNEGELLISALNSA